MSGFEKKTRAPRTLYFKLKAWSVYSIISIIVDKLCIYVQAIKKTHLTKIKIYEQKEGAIISAITRKASP